MNHENMMAVRQGLLQVVEALEQQMGFSLTTAKIRKWFKHFGPDPGKAQDDLQRMEAQKRATRKE